MADSSREIQDLPKHGVGLGFREPLRADIFLHRSKIDLLEITADHYFDATDRKRDELELLRETFPIVVHSLDLSLGSADGVDDNYLDKLAAVIEKLSPPWFSDHICFTRANGIHIGHLASLPYTNESLDVLARNISKVKERIGTPLILENITSDISFPFSEMSEAEFLTRVLNDNDCGMLLDVTNLYINSHNRNYNAFEFLDQIPLERVTQLHFVGSHRHGQRLIDAHADQTEPEIWNLFKEVCVRCNVKGAILERDKNFPEFSEIVEELDIARQLLIDEICSAPTADKEIHPNRSSAGHAA